MASAGKTGRELLSLRAPILHMVGPELPVLFQLGDGSDRAGLRELLALCVTELGAGKYLGQWPNS